MPGTLIASRSIRTLRYGRLSCIWASNFQYCKMSSSVRSSEICTLTTEMRVTPASVSVTSVSANLTLRRKVLRRLSKSGRDSPRTRSIRRSKSYCSTPMDGRSTQRMCERW